MGVTYSVTRIITGLSQEEPSGQSARTMRRCGACRAMRGSKRPRRRNVEGLPGRREKPAPVLLRLIHLRLSWALYLELQNFERFIRVQVPRLGSQAMPSLSASWLGQ